jgi:predicted nucleic acid-binding protein
MKPLIVDTSVWIEWLRDHHQQLREESRGRIIFLPAIVALELFSGAHSKKSHQLISNLIGTFERNRRIIIPTLEDYQQAGSLLSDLGWPASKKSNDVLIAVCARKIGGEIWTCDYSDFSALGESLRVTVRKIN